MTSLRWVALCLPAVLATACTSIPGVPTQGTGSKFNLAPRNGPSSPDGAWWSEFIVSVVAKTRLIFPNRA